MSRSRRLEAGGPTGRPGTTASAAAAAVASDVRSVVPERSAHTLFRELLFSTETPDPVDTPSAPDPVDEELADVPAWPACEAEEDEAVDVVETFLIFGRIVMSSGCCPAISLSSDPT